MGMDKPRTHWPDQWTPGTGTGCLHPQGPSVCLYLYCCFLKARAGGNVAEGLHVQRKRRLCSDGLELLVFSPSQTESFLTERRVSPARVLTHHSKSAPDAFRYEHILSTDIASSDTVRQPSGQNSGSQGPKVHSQKQFHS